MVEACAIDLRAPSSIVQFLPDQFSNNTKYLDLEYKLKLAAPKTAFMYFYLATFFSIQYNKHLLRRKTGGALVVYASGWSLA